ncbi:MAG TPA: hypothetical protein VE194_02325 [Rubrobacter sp.]|nr:hypothetical protein [Rubrobacter sp.]
MIIRGIEEHDLRAALEVANYAYWGNLRFREGPEPLTLNRQSWRLRLGVEDPDGLGHRRQSRGERSWWDKKERAIRSACYHAYRDFLYAVFERAPRARVVTSLAVYEGPTHFEATHRRISRLNVGSFFEPVRMEDCCDCPKGLRNEEMVPELYLGEGYALEPDRKIYSGLNTSERNG